jgi:ubiquinone/menaquinone biosynthesis C-methylase UbiE
MKKFINQTIENHQNDLDKLSFFDVLDTNLEDNKRHHTMLNHGVDLINFLKIDSVLTLGDKYCRDAAFIKKELQCYSVASDLNLSNMSKAKDIGYVDDIYNINAENILLTDESFDVVFCKESYHHFSRPQLALYEMLRVAKKAIVLIEPNDVRRNGIENFIEDNDFLDSFEDVGNYKYQVSLREILKTAWALRLPHVGVIGFNDPYTKPLVYDTWLNTKSRLDEMGKNKQRGFNLLAVCIYKQPIDSTLYTFTIYNLPPIIHR